MGKIFCRAAIAVLIVCSCIYLIGGSMALGPH